MIAGMSAFDPERTSGGLFAPKYNIAWPFLDLLKPDRRRVSNKNSYRRFAVFDLFTISDEQRICAVIAVMVLTILAELVW
jgi:hypothetical protein